ncbi:uncharacterized protein [Dasypus novemcinctus]|uniref:uncharacterized protein n=1 Tax=Dasypus novemcinctus TaxID=9361 RepID=UPI00265E212A|nr:uncharacterized protein LOC131273373 [Dasypus novemcinctus]
MPCLQFAPAARLAYWQEAAALGLCLTHGTQHGLVATRIRLASPWAGRLGPGGDLSCDKRRRGLSGEEVPAEPKPGLPGELRVASSVASRVRVTAVSRRAPALPFASSRAPGLTRHRLVPHLPTVLYRVLPGPGVRAPPQATVPEPPATSWGLLTSPGEEAPLISPFFRLRRLDSPFLSQHQFQGQAYNQIFSLTSLPRIPLSTDPAPDPVPGLEAAQSLEASIESALVLTLGVAQELESMEPFPLPTQTFP